MFQTGIQWLTRKRFTVTPPHATLARPYLLEEVQHSPHWLLVAYWESAVRRTHRFENPKQMVQNVSLTHSISCVATLVSSFWFPVETGICVLYSLQKQFANRKSIDEEQETIVLHIVVIRRDRSLVSILMFLYKTSEPYPPNSQ